MSKTYQVVVFDTESGNVVEKQKYSTLAGLHSYLDAVEKTSEFKAGVIDYSSETLQD